VTLAQALVAAWLSSAPDAGPSAPRSWLDPGRCPTHIQLRALGSVTSARRDWKILQAHFRMYGQCDDGPIAEGYSDNVVTLLAHNWNFFSELARLARSDSTFLQFVLTHIDATAATEDLQTVQRNALAACPAGNAELCRRIAAQATSALEERTPAQGK
jgi:hypothetical protein